MNIRASAITIATLLIVCSLHTATHAQNRDHLTPQEVELIKDTQILDKRIEVFIKAAERRVLVLTGTANGSNAKQLKKDSEKWGELPAGSPGELISDIARILDEAITNIDDVSGRDEKNPLIPKALRRLASAALRIVDQVRPFAAKADTNTFDQLTENADSIAQAASQLPPEVAKKGKGKEEKPKTTN